MANEILYVPGIGTRYYYDPNIAGTPTLAEIGSGSHSSAIENGNPTFTFNGKALQFSMPYVQSAGLNGSHTIEYWMTLTDWNNTGASHQYGYFGSHSVSFVKILPKPISGTNNINLQLDFGDGDPEDTTVTLPDQTSPIHLAHVFDTSDSNYQLKLFVNGTKVKEHYFHMPWGNTIMLGGSIASYGATALADSFSGKISDFLVSSGAKYTSTFTPARPTVNTGALSKAGNPINGFAAPEISYLEVADIPYKIVVAS